MDSEADYRILRGCTAGDKRAQEEFVRRFSDLVYRTVQGALRARGLPADKRDLEDLHHTVFVALFERGCRKLRQYQGKNGCTVSSWVRLVAVRTVLDTLRKARKDALSRREKLLTLDRVVNTDGGSPSQYAAMVQAERLELLQQGLLSLRPKDRLLLKLHCEEGLPLQKVAAILDITVNNAYSMKHRALKRLAAAVHAPAGPRQKVQEKLLPRV